MSLWRYPRTAAALCIAAVLACAAAPAAFLAASDAAYFGRVETVADPYRAPTPTADDYYILRQLAARGQDTTARQTTPQQEQDAAPQTPKVYIGASASIESMTWADTAATTAAENALWQLAESSAVPRFWVEQTVGDTVDYGSYTDANGQYYNLNSAYCTTDSLGFVTVRNSNHHGTCAYWGLQMAQRDMIVFVASNTPPFLAAPVSKQGGPRVG